MKIVSKQVFYFMPIILVGLMLKACINDDDGNPPDPFPDLNKGDIRVNRLKLTFTLDQDTSNVQIIEFSDPDGSGGDKPVKVDTLKLLGPASSGSKRNYSSTIDFFNGTNSVSDSIRNKEDGYVICYRNMNLNNLELRRSDLDKDGNKLGFDGGWSTIEITSPPQEKGEIRITLDFQLLGKDGQCDSGVTIMEATIPYKVEF